MENVYAINVAGQEISVYSSESEEYTIKIAKAVDTKIKEITGPSLGISALTAAVLTAMDYCEEVMKLRAGADNMREQIKAYLDDSTKAIAERDEARQMVEKLKDELLSLKINMSK